MLNTQLLHSVLIHLLLLLLFLSPLDASPVLNAGSDANPDTNVKCWRASSMINTPVDASNCYHAIHDFYDCPAPSAAIYFKKSPTSSAQYEVPARWRYNNCMVGMNLPRSAPIGRVEIATWAEIGTAMLAVVRQCVETGGPGGWTTVGANRQLIVAIVGLINPQSPPPVITAPVAAALSLAAVGTAMQCPSGFQSL